MSGGQEGGFKAPDQRSASSDREDPLKLPPWQGQGGRMEGSDSFRNSGVVGFRGGGGQGLELRGSSGGGFGGAGYGTPNYGVGGFGGGGYGEGVLGGQPGGGTGMSGPGVGTGHGAGGGFQGGVGGYQTGGGFQAAGGGLKGAGGLQAGGGLGGPSSRIFTSPGRQGLQI